MSSSAVLQVQNMWKCDYKLLKAQKRIVNRSHHENAVVWNPFPKRLKWDVAEHDGFCLHFHATSFVEIFLQINFTHAIKPCLL